MKKLLSLFICIILSLNFMSCKNTADNKSSKSYASNSNHIYIKLINKNVKTEKMDINYPEVEGLKNNYVSKKINSNIEETAFTVEKMTDIEPEDLSQARITVDYEQPFLNSSILSIKFRSSFYFEGISKPLNYISSITANLSSGKIYSLDDIFKKNSNYKEKLNDIISTQIRDENIHLLKPFEGIKDDQKFYFNKEGIVIYYQEEEYTSHSYGQLEFTIPYSEVKDILNIWIS